MPSEFVFKTLNAIHGGLLAISGGNLGWTAGKMPVVELTTTGRKSGLERTCLLTSPWQDGDAMALIASAGGNDQHPAWFLNLRDEPNVTVRTKAGTQQMTARVAAGEERAQVWAATTARYENYADYQAKANREIPVVILEPVK